MRARTRLIALTAGIVLAMPVGTAAAPAATAAPGHTQAGPDDPEPATVGDAAYIILQQVQKRLKKLGKSNEKASSCTNDGSPLPPKDGRITGTENDDDIVCRDLNDARHIEGLGGNDRITVKSRFAESVLIDGDAGNDTITVDDMSGSYRSPARLDGGTGDDTIRASQMSSNTSIHGGDGADNVNVDSVQGGGIYTGDGNDHLLLGSVSSVVYTEAGDDTVEGNGGAYGQAVYPAPGSYINGGEGNNDTCRHVKPWTTAGGTTINTIGTVTGFENTP